MRACPRVALSVLSLTLFAAGCWEDPSKSASEEGDSADSGLEATSPLSATAVEICGDRETTLPISSGEEALSTLDLALPIAELSFLESQAMAQAEHLADQGETCVTVEEDARAGTRHVVASCVNVDGVTLTGEWSRSDAGEGFHLLATDLVHDDGETVFRIDGEAALEDVDGDLFTFVAQITIEDAVMDDLPWARELDVRASHDASGDVVDGWMDVAAGLGERTGGVCFSMDDDQAVFQGAALVVLTGDEALGEGCSGVTIDGVEADPYCP